MLTMGLTAHTGKAVAVHNALETLTFGSTDNIHECNALGEDVGNRKRVAQFEIPREIRLEFDEFALGSGSCLCEMALESLAGVLFCCFVIGKLYSGITIFFYCTDLRDNARTSLDNGAWKVFPISTENGSHSDFLSN